MQQRPKLAVLVAEYITQWANLESMMAMSLAFILDSDKKAALAMYGTFDSRASQIRLLLAAAESKLELLHFRVLEAIHSVYIKPVMKERDRFAHWIWGYSPELTDALLLMEPSDKTTLHVAAASPPSPPQWDYSKIFVVREPDLTRALQRFYKAIEMYGRFTSTAWKDIPTPTMRAVWIDKLSNEPRIREFLDRPHRGNPGKPPEARAPSTPPGDGEESAK